MRDGVGEEAMRCFDIRVQSHFIVNHNLLFNRQAVYGILVETISVCRDYKSPRNWVYAAQAHERPYGGPALTDVDKCPITPRQYHLFARSVSKLLAPLLAERAALQRHSCSSGLLLIPIFAFK
jgi:hypothetical protein